MEANWANLPYDLIASIAKRVTVMEDFIAFGAVCTSWQAGASKENFDMLSLQVPLLMLADKDDVYREFYSLSKKKVSTMFLPEVRGRECFPSKGWICTLSSTGEMNLLQPFLRTQIQLPQSKALLDLCINDSEEEPRLYYILNAVLSANPSVTSDYTLVVSYVANADCLLASWRPGDLSWTCIDNDSHLTSVCSMIYYDGQFYVVDNHTLQVWSFDVPGPTVLQPVLKPYVLDSRIMLEAGLFYLVEVSGALLLVGRFLNKEAPGTVKFEVYELDVIKGELNEATLGDSTIFLGLGAPTSIDTSKVTGIKPNHIYFTDEMYYCKRLSEEGGGGKDMGAYDLEDGKIESFYPGLSISPISPPAWVLPSLS